MFSNVSFSQEINKEQYNNGQIKSVGRQNSDGKRIGEWKIYYENDHLHQIANYDNGKPTDEVKEFYETGQLNLIGNYENGELKGKYEEFYKNRQLYRTANMENWYLTGEAIVFIYFWFED